MNMSVIVVQRQGTSGPVLRGLAFTGLLAIAAMSLRIAILRYSGSGYSVAVALVASFVALTALNLMFVMIERWLGEVLR